MSLLSGMRLVSCHSSVRLLLLLLLTSLLTSSRWYAHYTWALRRVCKTGAGSLRWLIKSPPCCHSIGSIWFLNLLIVSAQTVVVGSRFHWSTTLCEKSPTIIIFLYLSHATFIQSCRFSSSISQALGLR